MTARQVGEDVVRRGLRRRRRRTTRSRYEVRRKRRQGPSTSTSWAATIELGENMYFFTILEAALRSWSRGVPPGGRSSECRLDSVAQHALHAAPRRAPPSLQAAHLVRRGRATRPPTWTYSGLRARGRRSRLDAGAAQASGVGTPSFCEQAARRCESAVHARCAACTQMRPSQGGRWSSLRTSARRRRLECPPQRRIRRRQRQRGRARAAGRATAPRNIASKGRRISIMSPARLSAVGLHSSMSPASRRAELEKVPLRRLALPQRRVAPRRRAASPG